MAKEQNVPISGYKLTDGTLVMFYEPFDCPDDCEPKIKGTYMGDDKWRFGISWKDKNGKSFDLIRVAKETTEVDFYFGDEDE